jgi:drug/metabolite transporter (DMT)-like permease
MIDVLILYAFYSMPISLGKAALVYAQPLFLVAVRMLMSAPLMLGYVYFFQRDKFKVDRAHYGLFAQATVLQIFFAYVLEYWALNNMNSSKNALIFTFAPFMTAIMCYFLYQEKITVKKMIGLVIGFVGSLPILLTHSTQEDIFSYIGFLSIPDIATIIAVACFAYGWIITGSLSKQYGYPAMMINGVTMLIGGAMVLLTSPLIDRWDPVPYTSFWPFMGYTIALIIVGNFIAFNWYIVLLRKYTATFIAFVGFTEPLYVALYSFLLLGETVTWQFFASLGIISLGLYLFYQEELQEKYL